MIEGMNTKNDADKIAREICRRFGIDPLGPLSAFYAGQFIAQVIAPLVAERDEWKAKYRQELADWAEDDTQARKMCEGILTELEVHGNSHYVPGMVDLIETLVKKHKELRAQLEKLRGAATYADEAIFNRVNLNTASNLLRDALYAAAPISNDTPDPARTP